MRKNFYGADDERGWVLYSYIKDKPLRGFFNSLAKQGIVFTNQLLDYSVEELLELAPISEEGEKLLRDYVKYRTLIVKTNQQTHSEPETF